MISSPIMTVLGLVLLNDGTKDAPAECQFDIGAEVNVISQRFTVEHNMKPISEAKLPRPTWMDGSSVYCYGVY